MNTFLYSYLRPLLFTLPPELAHNLTLPGLDIAHQLKITRLLFSGIPRRPCTVMGLEFPNPVGLAAGLDKNAEHVDSLGALGFGFIEVGTVTPRPQPGNPSPRIFRLPAAEALINRMGFNNVGVDKLVSHVKKSRFQGILGINIGKNVDTPLENAAEDYLTCLYKVYPYADYVSINISSPNTPHLRQLQLGTELEHLLARLKTAQEQLATTYIKYVPIVIKIAPDLSAAEITTIAKTLLDYDIDGVIATNTTVARPTVKHLHNAAENGGLSGKPLTALATAVVRQLSQQLQGKIPIIASGGVMSAVDALEKLAAGASLVQIYTGLIYRGPWLVKEILRELG